MSKRRKLINVQEESEGNFLLTFAEGEGKERTIRLTKYSKDSMRLLAMAKKWIENKR